MAQMESLSIKPSLYTTKTTEKKQYLKQAKEIILFAMPIPTKCSLIRAVPAKATLWHFPGWNNFYLPGFNILQRRK